MIERNSEMKQNNSKLLYSIIILLMAGVYSLVLFIIKKDLSAASQLAYGFTMIAFFAMVIVAYMSRTCVNSSMLFHTLKWKVTIAYFILQFFFGGFFIMCMDEVSIFFVLAAELVFLVFYLVVCILIRTKEEVTENLDCYVEESVSPIRMMEANLKAILARTQDEILKKSIFSLAEELKYSDPMSNDALKDIEKRIESNISLLGEDIDSGNITKAAQRAEKINWLLKERNDKSILFK